MIFTELDKKEFKKFLDKSPIRTFYQLPDMDKVEEEDGWKALYLGVKEDNNIIAATRLKYLTRHFNKKLFYAPRGLLLDYQNEKLLTFFVENLKKYLKKQNGYVLHIDPPIIYKERDVNCDLVEGGIDNSNVINTLKKLGFKHHGFTKEIDTSRQPRWSFELPLTGKTEEDIFKEMTTKKRRAIQKAEHLKVKVRELNKEELNIVKDIHESTSERRSFRDSDLSYYEKMYDVFHDKGEIKFMLAYVDLKEAIEVLKDDIKDLKKEKEKGVKYNKEQFEKRMDEQIANVENKIEELKEIAKEKGNIINLSSAMFMMYGRDILYLHSGSYKEYMYFSGQTLLQWVMIKEAIKQNKECYNFYGISGIFDKDDPNYGIYLFKKEFNGHVIEYIGDFYLPLSSYYYLQNSVNKIKGRK